MSKNEQKLTSLGTVTAEKLIALGVFPRHKETQRKHGNKRHVN